jgi:acetyl-CoA synthetase
VDEEGYYWFHSRSDDVILSSGYRIGPAEIEKTLNNHPKVKNSGVIGVPHDERGEIPKAFIVLAPEVGSSDALISELKTYVKENLAKYEYPGQIDFVPELPTTVTGKVQRTELKEWEGIE